MTRPDSDNANASDHQPVSTLLESFDTWAQVLRQSHPQTAHALPPARPASAAPSATEAEPYRPILRPPLALLHVVDDGRDDGETIRLRGDRVVIGRTDGDVMIDHDISMSPRHALLERSAGAGWLLSDLGSAGGTFVRVLAARLHHGSCFRIGSTRFRFDAPPDEDAGLLELVADGDAPRHPCHPPATTLGRSGCGSRITVGDRFVSPLHAELRYTTGGWRIENRGLNGLWVQIDAPVKLGQPAQFQCGEQRFVFVPLAE